MGNALEIGVIFAGRYRVVRCMAQGGMAAIYEVIHLETDRRCALKIVHAHLLRSEAIARRFQREARIAARVESAFIVDVFDAGVDATTQTPFLVMELLRGEELGRRIKRVGPLPPDDVVSYLHQTALALDETHRAGVVHRDVKPENLFVTELAGAAPRIKVLDFGVAKVLAEAQASQSTTLSAGTPRYMAPEQFDPYATITGAADIYALGLIAYTCLVGAPYWLDEPRAHNIFAFAAIAKLGPLEPASARAERMFGVLLPAGFDAWFAKAAHVDPSQRFESATAAIDALRIVLGVRTSELAPPLATSAAPRADRRRGRAGALVAAAGLAIVLVGMVRIGTRSLPGAFRAAHPSASEPSSKPRAEGSHAGAGAHAFAEHAAAAMAQAAFGFVSSVVVNVPVALAAEPAAESIGAASAPAGAARPASAGVSIAATAAAPSSPAPPPIDVAKKKAATTPPSRGPTDVRPPAATAKRYTQE